MRKSNKYALGVDVGATIVKIGLVNSKGKIVYKTSLFTSSLKTKAIFIERVIKQIRQIVKEKELLKKNLAGIGIGLPGSVDYAKGIVHNLTNIKNWKGIPLRGILRKHFDFPIHLDNDANAFAQGQLKWGKAQGVKNAICVTLGSGVGGGLIINGKVYRGSNYSAGEIGHVCIDVHGPKCGCKSNGCLESFVGNKYIVNRAIERIKNGQKTSLVKKVNGRLNLITPEMITEAAKEKDVFSVKTWEEVGTYLGIGLGGMVNVINPEKIIIGGGISKSGKFIFSPLQKELKKRTMKQHLKILKVVKADFVDDAGVMGAASLAMERR